MSISRNTPEKTGVGVRIEILVNRSFTDRNLCKKNHERKIKAKSKQTKFKVAFKTPLFCYHHLKGIEHTFFWWVKNHEISRELMRIHELSWILIPIFEEYSKIGAYWGNLYFFVIFHGFCGLGIEKIRKKSRKSKDCPGQRRFLKNLQKSALPWVILTFSWFFTDFVGWASRKSACAGFGANQQRRADYWAHLKP